MPDIVTLAKSLGGGKAAVGAYVARRPVFVKAYGSSQTALIHGPATFAGMGEACVTAIEALNTLYDEELMDNAAAQGAYLVDRLRSLQRRYPGLIADVRGRGLMVGLEMGNISTNMPRGFRTLMSMLDERLRGGLAAIVGSLLLHRYDVLVAFTEYDRNVIRLEPPLIVEREHVDVLVDSLDDLLARDFTRVAMDYVRTVKVSSGQRQLIGGVA